MSFYNHSAVMDLHNRLDRLEDRISDIRSAKAGLHPELEKSIASFEDRHQAIRSLIDENVFPTAVSTAQRATSDLETGLESWLTSVDRRFAVLNVRQEAAPREATAAV